MGEGGGSRECLTAFVPTSDCRFNCHGMIYVPVSEGKLIVTNFQLLAPLVLGGAPILSPAGGAIAPPAPPGHHATACNVVDGVETYSELPDFKRILRFFAHLQVLNAFPVLSSELSVIVGQQGGPLEASDVRVHEGATSVLAMVQIEADHSSPRAVCILNDLMLSEKRASQTN